MSEHTSEKWVVIDSGGRVMLKAAGEPQIICTLEIVPLKISPQVHARAHLIAAAPELLEACEWYLHQYDSVHKGKDHGQTPWLIRAAIAKATEKRT